MSQQELSGRDSDGDQTAGHSHDHGQEHDASSAPMTPIIVAGVESTALDVGALVDSVRRDDCGGIVVFEGTVRSPNKGHQVLALDYEAWEDRVPAQLESFARSAAQRHGLGAALAVHRVGRVEVGDAAVVVVAVSAHRDVAFIAASELIDQVKAEGWIWKKELRADGEIWIDGC